MDFNKGIFVKWIRSRRVVRSFRKFSKIKKLERIVCFFHFQNNVPKITYFAYFRFPRSLRIPHRHIETASLGKELFFILLSFRGHS